LYGYKYSNYFKTSIELALYYLKHNTEYPMDFYLLFGELWGFSKKSYEDKYIHERILVEELTKYYNNEKTPEAALCLTFFISNCLKYQFSAGESNWDNAVRVVKFGLLNCTEIFEIRDLCFKALSIFLVL
jgi:hypothetical protein